MVPVLIFPPSMVVVAAVTLSANALVTVLAAAAIVPLVTVRPEPDRVNPVPTILAFAPDSVIVFVPLIVPATRALAEMLPWLTTSAPLPRLHPVPLVALNEPE